MKSMDMELEEEEEERKDMKRPLAGTPEIRRRSQCVRQGSEAMECDA